MYRSVSIIIPAYNEEKKLAPTVNFILETLDRNNINDFEVIIFDDASTDKTGEVADELASKYSQIKVIHNPKNMNLGFNITRGFQLATKEYVGFVPGDNETDSESLDNILQVLGKADIIVPYIKNPEVRPWGRRFLSRAYVLIINTAFNLKTRYFNGLCFFKTSMVKKVPVTTYGFSYMTEILVKLLKSGATFVEVPMINKVRERGSTKAFRPKNVASVFKTFLTLFWQVQILRRRINLS
ncbi:MAG: glycosyltransferase family 2 protein [Candidatus Azambacteria bacterium]|nr:glycosyltransferase family 2 protein [Candidatus Azambacteria bacterium]